MLDKVYLVGLPGSGKSTFGKILAKELKYDFIDLDDAIVKKQGQSITEIFESFGEDRFREIEKETLLHTLNLQKVVIATGGGTPCFFENMQMMMESGLTVFLSPPIETVLNRLKEDTSRPLLQNQDPRTKIEELLKNRRSFYQKAKVTIKDDQPSTYLIKRILSERKS